MAILITERNARRLDGTLNDRSVKDLSASRIFDVTGVTTATEALAALAARDPGPIDYGQPHPQDGRATIARIGVEENAVAGMFTVNVGYSSVLGNGTLDLLLEPPVISIKNYRRFIMSDKDANGVPFLNCANFPYEGGTPVIERGIIWRYSRWETVYPYAVDAQYGGKINSNNMTFPGLPGTYGAGKVLFNGIEQGERANTAAVVRCHYEFDICENGHTNDVINQGAAGYGFINSDTPRPAGLFVHATRASDTLGTVRLKSDGTPINAEVKVAPPYKKALDPIGPPGGVIAASVVSPPVGDGGKSTYPASDTGVVVQSFAKHKSVAMSITL